jgi:hypothetical protein
VEFGNETNFLGGNSQLTVNSYSNKYQIFKDRLAKFPTLNSFFSSKKFVKWAKKPIFAPL